MKLSLNLFQALSRLKMTTIKMFILINLKKAEGKKKIETTNKMLSKHISTLQQKQLLLIVIEIQFFWS